MLFCVVGRPRIEKIPVTASYLFGGDADVLHQKTLKGISLAAAPSRKYAVVSSVGFKAEIENSRMAGSGGRRGFRRRLSSLFSVLLYPLRANVLDKMPAVIRLLSHGNRSRLEHRNAAK